MVIRTSESVTENIFRDFYGSNVFIEKSAIPNSYGFLSKSDTENIEIIDETNNSDTSSEEQTAASIL